MIRETYYSALFSLLQPLLTAGTLVTLDRRLRFLEEVPAAEMPAAFLTVADQETDPRTNLPPKRTLSAQLYLYVASAQPNEAPGPVLNALLDAVEAAIAPSIEPQTLGGLVHYARIEGRTHVYEAPSNDRCAALLTIQMLVP